MNVNGTARFELLSNNNYDTWKIQMRAILIKNDAWIYVDGSCVKPEGELTSAAVQAWVKGDLKAQSDVILGMNPSVIKQVKTCTTANAIWKKLEEVYESKAPVRKAALLNSLISYKLCENDNPREKTQDFLEIIDKLADMDITIHKDLLSVILLRSLPESLENFRCAISSRDELPDPESLRGKIIDELETRKGNVAQNSSAMIASGNMQKKKKKLKKKNSSDSDETAKDKKDKKGGKGKCTHCGRINHVVKDCWYANNSGENSAKNADHVGLYIAPSTNKHEVLKINEKQRDWCIDSGCTSHMCNDANIFAKIDSDKPETLNLASNACTEVTGRGMATLTTKVDGRDKIVDLKDTLYVPDLRTNLISVGKITDKGHTVIFDKESAKVFDPDRNVILAAKRINGLYYVPKNANECNKIDETNSDTKIVKKNSLFDWHIRLGHLNTQSLREAIRSGAIKGACVNDMNDFVCETCFEGKMSRTPFAKKSNRETTLGDLIHSDVCGPMRVASNGRKLYFVTFIDDFSGWCEVRFIMHKNEVLNEFKSYRALVETQLGKRIKCIQSDNGLEYVNREFDEFLQEQGITRRLTVPHNPQQNGVAERRNRTLMETARCLLAQSELSPSFWAEAVNAANFIRNRCPTSKLKGKTPYEAWIGKPPDVGNFQRFGCEVHILDQTPNKSKLASRSKKGIFIGYNLESKGYKVWIPSEGKFQTSRDVKFLDTPHQRNITENDFAPKNHNQREESIPIDKEENNSIEIPLIQNQHQPEELEPDFEPNINEDSESSDVSDEEFFDAPVVQDVVRRGPGRPRKVLTGLPGRPRKQYQERHEEQAEMAFNAEIPVNQALTGPESDQWLQTMADEVESILKNDTWELIQLPKGRSTVGSRFVLCNKYGTNGTFEKRKARIVARGFSQQPGRDVHETFAPVARLGSIRLAVALAAQRGMFIRQYDVKTAYLNGTLEEELFMKPPEEMGNVLRHMIQNERYDKRIVTEAKSMLQQLMNENVVCRLKKALYGLKQAGRAWNKRLDTELRNLGLTPTNGDPCLYLRGDGDDQLLVVIYVDDILAMSRNLEIVKKFGTTLGEKFEVKDIGDVKRCLGMDFIHGDDCIKIHQESYVKELLRRFGMQDCKTVSTPIDVSTKLTKEDQWRTTDGPKPPYRELIGGLLYLSVATRPDLAHVASVLSQFNDCFGKTHWVAAKRVLRYLKGTANYGIVFRHGRNDFQGFVDADWAGSIDDRRSFTGYVFKMNGGCISWDSRKQTTVALSSTEAEYMALSEVSKEAVYLRRFLKELGINAGTIKVSCDNIGAQKLATNPVFHSRTKHIDIRHHFVREKIKNGEIHLEYVPTEEMTADVLTKGLTKQKHIKGVELLGLSKM